MFHGFMYLMLLHASSPASAVNILALFPIVSPSHHHWNSRIVIALAQNGHNITVVSPDIRLKPVKNVTDLLIEGAYDGDYNYEDMTHLSIVQQAVDSYNFMAGCCKQAIKSTGFKQLMGYPPEMKFDLIIVEASAVECLLGVIPKFGYPKIVVISAYNVPASVLELSGAPNFPSYMPHYWNPSKSSMSFKERIWNLFMNVFVYILYHYIYLREMDEVARENFGSDIPSAWHMMRNISIAVANTHPMFDYPWPLPPNIIPVGGLQIREARPLPKDISDFLDEAVDGAIYFSLGSNIRSDKLSPGKLQDILAAFAQLPQRVLWKFESDSIKNLPKNVRLGTWLPQSDILAHPNVLLFISHCGLLGSQEAVHRGVPVVGIPFFADQHINIQRLINHGTAILLEYKDLTAETLIRAVNTVIYDPSYKENMRRLSERFRDNPLLPFETAIFWIEYVIRHNGATHLRPVSADLNLIQYLLLDVIVFLLFILLSLIFLFYLFCCKRTERNNKVKKS